MLAGKKIILGITGSIAAYKSAVLTRLLVKGGAEVKIVMTPAARDFITPLTLSTLSKNEALTDFVKDDASRWNNHVELGLWADVLIIAPASANTLAKMANGLCDNLLMAVYLSARCPVFFAPAMDLDMLKHATTQRNIAALQHSGNILIAPQFGDLASGLIGNGRMTEPEEIVEVLEHYFEGENKLKGKKALVTAGPTHEAIDPVRFIGNNSSGKMGFAIAEVLAYYGAEVDLISGPTSLSPRHKNIRMKRVTSAMEMHAACTEIFPSSDIAVLSAAVADYRPARVADQKIKKTDNTLVLELIKTPDIAADLGKLKKDGQLIVGFALETENEEANAEKKIIAKNFDFVVLNSLNDTGAGFGVDTNKISIIDRQNRVKKFSLKNKTEVAGDIVKAIIDYADAHA
jgi:phosphopantothenoylcysteine decarboxylase/phosphopantothenate--cysteine ligase